MSTRREIADAATLVEHEGGARELRWADGISRVYTRQEIAALFLDAAEQGHTNPLLEKLLLPGEANEMYEALEDLADSAAEILAADAAIPGV